MRLALSVLNIMKEMETMSPYFFIIYSPYRLCFNLLQVTKFLQSQKHWVRSRLYLPSPNENRWLLKQGHFQTAYELMP